MCSTSAAREPIIQARALCERDLDCEQSLFFFRFSESNARARERRSLSRLAPSVTRVAICVSRVLLDGLQKKDRLLVV